MKVIVSGAGGFIGTNMVMYLLEQGYEVIGFDIKKSKSSIVNKYLYLCSFLDVEQVLQVCEGKTPDFIIHLAAETGMDSDSPEKYSFNYESIEAIRQITHHHPSIQKVIITSSLLVCKNGYIPVNNFDLCPPNGYGHSKAISEALTHQILNKVRWDIVRPTSIWGEHFSGGYELFFKLIRYNLFFNPNIEPIIKPTCYVGNAVYMIHKIMLDKGDSRVFYLADYPVRSVQEWASAISSSFHGKNKLRRMNLGLLKFFARIGDLVGYLGISFPLTTFRLKNILVSQEYPTENTLEVVGSLPYSLKESCLRTVLWMKKQSD